MVDTYHEREAALAQMDNGRVEVGSLMEGRKDNRGRQGRRALCMLTMVSLSVYPTCWDVDPEEKLELES